MKRKLDNPIIKQALLNGIKKHIKVTITTFQESKAAFDTFHGKRV